MSFVQPLLELQDVDGCIRELEQEIVDIPERKKQENARLDHLREILASAHGEQKAVQLRIEAADLEAESRKLKIQELKKHQVMLKTNKEFSMYNLEINKLEEDIASHEAREIAAMDDLIPIRAKVADIEAKLVKEQAGVDEYLAELDVRLVEVKQVLAETLVEREAVEGKVQARSKLYYDRLKSKRWPVVVKLLNGSVCTGCNLVQPPSVGQMVCRDQEVVFCTMCGRILYMD